MSFVKYAAAAAAFAGSALAQCSTDTTTIRNAGDATSLGSCPTFTGAVVIPTDAVGTFNFGSLGGIRGDFNADAPNVTSIQADSIQSIGRFSLKNMQALYTLSMQQLRSVDSITWDNLAQLPQPNFGDGLMTVNDAINIQNTQIQDLSALNVREIMGDVNIANNPQLSNLTWSTTNMSGRFIASGNGFQQLNLSLPMLKSVGKDFDVSNASDVAVGNLSTVGGLFSVQSSSLQSLMLPALTQAASLQVANNKELRNVSLPMLNETSMGALKLINNDKLGGDIQLPALINIQGDLNITGAFESVNIPKLRMIKSTCYLWSTEDIDSTCNQVSQWQNQGKIPGKLAPGPEVKNGIVCHSKSQAATAAGGSGTTTSSSGSSSSSSSNAAPGGYIATPATLFGATGLVAAMLGLI